MLVPTSYESSKENNIPTIKTMQIIPPDDHVFQKNSQPISPPDQLEEIKNMIQNLVMEVNQLKLKQTGNQTDRN